MLSQANVRWIKAGVSVEELAEAWGGAAHAGMVALGGALSPRKRRGCRGCVRSDKTGLSDVRGPSASTRYPGPAAGRDGRAS